MGKKMSKTNVVAARCCYFTPFYVVISNIATLGLVESKISHQ